MAEIMLRVFGSKLLTAPVDADEEVHPRLGDKLKNYFIQIYVTEQKFNSSLVPSNSNSK